MSELLAVIPARGGSKGIPRKNIQIIAGKPLIAHVILQARSALSVDRVMVSTDDPEIANVSLSYGAEVVQRPDGLSGDDASSESAILHVLDYLAESEDYSPDYLILLQCTSPLTRAEDIDGTFEALVRENADSELSVTKSHQFLWRLDRHNAGTGINHRNETRQRRKDRDAQYLESGAAYAMKTDGFQIVQHRFFWEDSTVRDTERNA